MGGRETTALSECRVDSAVMRDYVADAVSVRGA